MAQQPLDMAPPVQDMAPLAPPTLQAHTPQISSTKLTPASIATAMVPAMLELLNTVLVHTTPLVHMVVLEAPQAKVLLAVPTPPTLDHTIPTLPTSWILA
jgi:hypothetical protein